MGDFSGQLRLVRTFGDGEPGELILYKNSYGFMEVGINKGNANKVINTREGENVCLEGYTQGDSSHSILAT
jgi:S-adenosylmethionine hydrolase